MRPKLASTLLKSLLENSAESLCGHRVVCGLPTEVSFERYAESAARKAGDSTRCDAARTHGLNIEMTRSLAE